MTIRANRVMQSETVCLGKANRPKRAPALRRAVIETIESRLLLSATPSPATRIHNPARGATAPAANSAPIVSAGAAQKIFDPTSSVTLLGTASDPDGNTLTYAWTKVSGPGVVTFSNSASLGTTATFSGAGDFGNYILRLTASDGSATQSSNVAIAYAPFSNNLLGYWPLDTIASNGSTPDLSGVNPFSNTFNAVVVPGTSRQRLEL